MLAPPGTLAPLAFDDPATRGFAVLAQPGSALPISEANAEGDGSNGHEVLLFGEVPWVPSSLRPAPPILERNRAHRENPACS